MPGRKPASRALKAFCATVNALGRERYGDEWRDVRSTHVERWAPWGLVPDVDRPGRGRGAGRDPQYGEEHIDAVVESAVVVRRHRSIPLAVAIVYLRGRPIRAAPLRKAYIELIGRFEKMVSALAEEQRGRLQAPDVTPTELAEMAEAGMAERLASHPETAALRARFREAGFGVENTLEVMSAALLQMFTTGTVNADDLRVLNRRLNVPVIPDSAPKASWLPTDDEIREKARLSALTKVIRAATQEDFEYARDAVTRMHRIMDNAQARSTLEAYGLSDLIEIVRTKSEGGQALALLQPLMFKVAFGVDVIAIAEFLASNPPE